MVDVIFTDTADVKWVNTSDVAWIKAEESTNINDLINGILLESPLLEGGLIG